MSNTRRHSTPSPYGSPLNSWAKVWSNIRSRVSVNRHTRTNSPAAGTDEPRSTSHGSRVMPEIENPMIIGVLGLVAAGVSAAATHLKPMAHPSRESSRIAQVIDGHVRETLTAHHSFSVVDRCGISMGEPWDVKVAVRTRVAFGRPCLVEVRIDIETGNAGRDINDEAGVAAVTRAARDAWDCAPHAPASVRVSVRSREHEWALRDAGFEENLARPRELFERFGPSASDPSWVPE